MKKTIYIFTCIVLLIFSGRSMAQEIKKDSWQKGYIILLSGDTIRGIIDKPEMETESDELKFYDSTKKKRKKYDATTIKIFVYNDTLFRFFKYSGWSKLIQKGSIDVYKGNIYATTWGLGEKKKMECLVFKKGNLMAKFIGANDTNSPRTPVFVIKGGVLKKETKEYFSEYVTDNAEVLKEFNTEKFMYEDLEHLIVKYNQLTKTN